jgi:cation/acetate symporter
LGVTIYYMVVNAPGFRHFWELDPYGGLWWGIQPLSAGVFGVPVGFAVMALATWLIPQRPTDPNLRSQAPLADPSNPYPGL